MGVRLSQSSLPHRELSAATGVSPAKPRGERPTHSCENKKSLPQATKCWGSLLGSNRWQKNGRKVQEEGWSTSVANHRGEDAKARWVHLFHRIEVSETQMTRLPPQTERGQAQMWQKGLTLTLTLNCPSLPLPQCSSQSLP